MTLIGEVVLTKPFLFVETFERLPDLELTFENIYYVPDSDGSVHYEIFARVSRGPSTDLDAILEQDSTVRDHRKVAEDNGDTLWRLMMKKFAPDEMFLYPFMREHDIVEIRSVRTREGLRVKALFPSRDTFRDLRDTIEELGKGPKTVRIYSEDETVADEHGLTEKQQMALTQAYGQGYFSTPQETTLASLAEELDITPQTLSTHIRAGVEKLVEAKTDTT